MSTDGGVSVFTVFSKKHQMSLKTLKTKHIQFQHVRLDKKLLKNLRDAGYIKKGHHPQKDELKKYLLAILCYCYSLIST